MTSVDSSDHGVPKLEAYLYFHGLRGNRKLGPKLIWRSSTDVFSPLSGPSQDVRAMQLLTVHEHTKLGKDKLWPQIREETVQLLDDNKIKLTSVDLVRFRWEEQTEDGRGKTVTSPVTIWIGVLPDSTNGDAAFNSAQDIIKLLKRHDIDDIDIAYRESKAQPLAGPILYAPVNDVHPLKSVIDWVTTPLSLPIAGLKTRHMQGTLGFYFKIGEDLYGATARHVLFPDTQGNEAYRYDTSAPKKNVILMGNRGFDDLLASIQALIGTLNNTVVVLEKNVRTYTTRVEGGNQQAAADLARFQQNLDDTRATIVELKSFFATLKRDWSDVNNRVIGHVVWSPPITGFNPPDGYTRDVCVIKLDKEKFLPNFRGNAIDLGARRSIRASSWVFFTLGSTCRPSSTTPKTASISSKSFSPPPRSRSRTARTSRATPRDSSSSVASQRSPPSVVSMVLSPTSVVMDFSATLTLSRPRCTRTTTIRVRSLEVATLELLLLAPRTTSSPSSPAVPGLGTRLTSPTVPPWSGCGMSSSKASSPTPSSSSTTRLSRNVLGSSVFLSSPTTARSSPLLLLHAHCLLPLVLVSWSPVGWIIGADGCFDRRAAIQPLPLASRAVLQALLIEHL